MCIGKSINVAYIGNNNPFKFKRGVENVIASQADSIKNGNKYYIFFDDSYSVFRWNNCICIGIRDNLFKYIILNYIIFILKKKKKVLIHSHGPVKTVMLLYKTDVLTIHDAIYYQRKGLGQRMAFIFYFVEKIAYIKSKKLHFISKYAMQQALISKRQLDKSVVIYNTSPLEKLINIPSQIVSMENASYNILAVRGIQQRTRIDLLVDFAYYVKDKIYKGKKINLYIAGKGDLLDYYQKQVKLYGLDNIHLLGYVSDEILVNYYRNCDMVILPCEHAEGFGLPIIEGYMFNKPVIGSNKCAVPEIIYSKDFLFENNPESIMCTIRKNENKKNDYKTFYDKKYSCNRYNQEILYMYKLIYR